jgi:hypothetical protein
LTTRGPDEQRRAHASASYSAATAPSGSVRAARRAGRTAASTPAAVPTTSTIASWLMGAVNRARLVVIAYEAGLVRPGWLPDE